MKESTAFLAKAVIIWAVLSLPGNFATLYFYFWSSPDGQLEQYQQANTTENVTTTLETTTTLGSTEDNGGSNITCYEKIEDYSKMRESARFWLEGICITVVGIVGFCGNIMAIFVLRTYTTNVSFNRLLMSLAVVDSLLILDMIVQKSIIGNFVAVEPLWYKVSYPFFWHPSKGMIQSGAIFMVVAVSAERYRAVCHPLSKRQACHKFVLFVLALAVVKNLPRYVQFQLIENKTDYWTSSIMENPEYVRFSSYWDEIFISGIVPLVSLVFFNTRIYLKIRSSAKFEYRFVGGNRGQNLSSGNRDTEKSRSSESRKHHSLPKDEYLSIATRSETRDVFEVRRLKSHQHRLSEGNLKSLRKNQNLNDRWTDVKLLEQTGHGSTPRLHEPLNLSNLEAKELPLLGYGTLGKSLSQSNIKNVVAAAGKKAETGPNGPPIQHRPSLTGQLQFRKKKEKSTVILVSIVVLFMLCHSYRLCLKLYEFAKPSSHVMDSFTYCFQQQRYHVPVVMYVLHNFHYLFLVFNSSANFVIYCFVAKDFRSRMFQLISSMLKRRSDSETQLNLT